MVARREETSPPPPTASEASSRQSNSVLRMAARPPGFSSDRTRHRTLELHWSYSRPNSGLYTTIEDRGPSGKCGSFARGALSPTPVSHHEPPGTGSKGGRGDIRGCRTRSGGTASPRADCGHGEPRRRRGTSGRGREGIGLGRAGRGGNVRLTSWSAREADPFILQVNAAIFHFCGFSH
jgi:hypothetical protein